MDAWLLVLTPLAVLGVVGLVRFVGCSYNPPVFDDTVVQDYGPTVLGEADLVSYWRLGEATCAGGSVAADQKAAHPGTYRTVALAADPPLLSPAAPGILQCGQPGLLESDDVATSVLVDGGFVEVPFSADLNPPQFTVEAWVRPEWPAAETGVFRCVVASREDTGAGGRQGYILYAGPTLDPATFAVVDPAIRWQAWVGDGTTWRMLVSPAPVALADFNYLAVTYDGTTLRLYVFNAMTDMDGDLSEAVVSYSPNPGKRLYIGMGAPERPAPLYPFKGRMQEGALYRAALPGDRIVAHIASGIMLASP
jgi:hypothetical protein